MFVIWPDLLLYLIINLSYGTMGKQVNLIYDFFKDNEMHSKLKSTSVKKAPNQTPFFASTAILEKNFLIRSGCLFLNHLYIPLNYT